MTKSTPASDSPRGYWTKCARWHRCSEQLKVQDTLTCGSRKQSQICLAFFSFIFRVLLVYTVLSKSTTRLCLNRKVAPSCAKLYLEACDSNVCLGSFRALQSVTTVTLCFLQATTTTGPSMWRIICQFAGTLFMPRTVQH